MGSDVSTTEVRKKYDLGSQYSVIEPWLKENGKSVEDLPLTAKTDDGQDVIVEFGGLDEDGNNIYQLTYLQDNGWARINRLYADFTVEESFSK